MATVAQLSSKVRSGLQATVNLTFAEIPDTKFTVLLKNKLVTKNLFWMIPFIGRIGTKIDADFVTYNNGTDFDQAVQLVADFIEKTYNYYLQVVGPGQAEQITIDKFSFSRLRWVKDDSAFVLLSDI